MSCLTCTAKHTFVTLTEHTGEMPMIKAEYCRACWIDYMSDELERLDDANN